MPDFIIIKFHPGFKRSDRQSILQVTTNKQIPESSCFVSKAYETIRNSRLIKSRPDSRTRSLQFTLDCVERVMDEEKATEITELEEEAERLEKETLILNQRKEA